MAVCRSILGYPGRAWSEFYPRKPGGTALMGLLVALFVAGAFVMFLRHVWSPVLLPWEGTVKAKDLRSTVAAGGANVATYVLLVERPDGRQTEHAVGSAFYAGAKENDRVAKPFLYSRILRNGASREAAVQLQDLFILLVSALLFAVTAFGGSSFIAVLYVSLFLHDPRKKRR